MCSAKYRERCSCLVPKVVLFPFRLGDIKMHKGKFYPVFIILMALILNCTGPDSRWEPNTDWGHWRLGHRSNPEFLRENRFTVTFGSGAPNFEHVTREEFDQKMKEAKAFNQTYHDSGYIVLRYLSTSLNGESETRASEPLKDQIHMLDFYQHRWKDFEDYIGPKPPEAPTEWITVRPDGTFPFYRYAPYGRETDEGFETWGCPNNPYYVRMMEGRVRAQAETGIDGSYVDWTHIAGGTCYCKYCRKNFVAYLKDCLPGVAAKAKYGISDYDRVEPPQNRKDPFWMEWITFRCHTVANFHNRLRTVARQYNPNFMISGNVFGGFGYGPIAYDAAGNVELLGKVDDFVYSEIQEFLDSAPRKDAQGTKITNSPALKFLTAATHGKPVIEYATEITPPIFPDPTEKCLSAMSQINIAEAVANHAVFREKRLTPPGATAIHTFLAANENYLFGARLASPIAVLSSLNPYFADDLSFAFSMSRVLADKGIAHEFLLEDDVENGKVGSYDMIVIPYLPLLSCEVQDGLVSYVREGGTLFILGKSGVKDQFNVPIKIPPLWEIFGGNGYPTHPTVTVFGKGRAAYEPFPIPNSRYLIPAKSKGEVTTFGPSMQDVFPDIPEAYTRNRMDTELRQILDDVADTCLTLCDGNVSRILEGSPYVELTTMMNSRKNCMLVHLVNYDVTLDGTITPAQDVSIQIAVPRHVRIVSVEYSGDLMAMESVDFRMNRDREKPILTFRADRVNVYGLAVIQFE